MKRNSRLGPGACVLVAAALSLASAPRWARADGIRSGHIIRIEDREIYFDIAASSGLKVGDALRIKRPIKLRHPVENRMVSDWLPLGSARVTMVGTAMAMAVLDDKLLARVAVGDIVESLVLDKPIPPAPRPAAPPEPVEALPDEPREPLPAVDPDTQAVLDLWNSTAGANIDVRIGAWQDFLAKRPDSPYAAAIYEDLEVLRAHRDKLYPAEIDLDQSFTGGLQHDAPTRARAGETLELAFLVDRPDLAAAWLHYRLRGAASYSKGVLERDDADYVRGRIPASAVQGPGIEYFVEIVTDQGRVGTAVGSPEAPVRVEVPSPSIASVFRERKNRSRVTMTSAYLDFASFDDRAGDRTDAYFVFEADFLYRLRGALYGVRTGLGVISGAGGFADAMYTEEVPAPKAGFNYGYTELELRGGASTALLVRLVAGVGRRGFGLGMEGSVRLGAEDGTNLSLGVSGIQEIGFLTELRMQWNALENVPLGLAVALTDQPAQGDLGVRLTTDIGYRALSWVQPTIRVSYQGRTVVHSGIGVGLGLVFDW